MPSSKESEEVKDRPTIEIARLEVKTSELCFVTSVDSRTRTFFAQLCKFSNEELNEFNRQLNKYCNQSSKPGADAPPVHSGDIVCAKYSRDNSWYRARVLSRDKQDKRNLTVLYIDYGNVERVTREDVLIPSESELPIIKRVPFGISCFLDGSQSLQEAQAGRLLECLLNNYLLVKVVERQSKLQWKVQIPRHAYNMPFWSSYQPKKDQISDKGRDINSNSDSENDPNFIKN